MPDIKIFCSVRVLMLVIFAFPIFIVKYVHKDESLNIYVVCGAIIGASLLGSAIGIYLPILIKKVFDA